MTESLSDDHVGLSGVDQVAGAEVSKVVGDELQGSAGSASERGRLGG